MSNRKLDVERASKKATESAGMATSAEANTVVALFEDRFWNRTSEDIEGRVHRALADLHPQEARKVARSVQMPRLVDWRFYPGVARQFHLYLAKGCDAPEAVSIAGLCLTGILAKLANEPERLADEDFFMPWIRYRSLLGDFALPHRERRTLYTRVAKTSGMSPDAFLAEKADQVGRHLLWHRLHRLYGWMQREAALRSSIDRRRFLELAVEVSVDSVATRSVLGDAAARLDEGMERKGSPPIEVCDEVVSAIYGGSGDATKKARQRTSKEPLSQDSYGDWLVKGPQAHPEVAWFLSQEREARARLSAQEGADGNEEPSSKTTDQNEMPVSNPSVDQARSEEDQDDELVGFEYPPRAADIYPLASRAARWLTVRPYERKFLPRGRRPAAIKRLRRLMVSLA